MLAVATWPHGCIAILADEATLFRELRTSCDARPGRILQAALQVMSLRGEHYSNSSDIVSHPDDKVQQRGRLQIEHPTKRSEAGPVCCNDWFASLPAVGWPTGPGTGHSAYHILWRPVLMPDSFLVR